ncbi:hypothetical protein FOZ63_029894, partial [Perkinsus olseni]
MPEGSGYRSTHRSLHDECMLKKGVVQKRYLSPPAFTSCCIVLVVTVIMMLSLSGCSPRSPELIPPSGSTGGGKDAAGGDSDNTSTQVSPSFSTTFPQTPTTPTRSTSGTPATTRYIRTTTTTPHNPTTTTAPKGKCSGRPSTTLSGLVIYADWPHMDVLTEKKYMNQLPSFADGQSCLNAHFS